MFINVGPLIYRAYKIQNYHGFPVLAYTISCAPEILALRKYMRQLYKHYIWEHIPLPIKNLSPPSVTKNLTFLNYLLPVN